MISLYTYIISLTVTDRPCFRVLVVYHKVGKMYVDYKKVRNGCDPCGLILNKYIYTSVPFPIEVLRLSERKASIMFLFSPDDCQGRVMVLYGFI